MHAFGRDAFSLVRNTARLGARGALPTLLLCLAACSGPTGPGSEVIGAWGGDNVEARATAVAFEVQLRCFTMRTRPLVSDDMAGFEIDGIVSVGLPLGVGTPIRLKGRVSADTLYLESSIRFSESDGWSPFESHVAIKGDAPAFHGSCVT